jgi:hypothetical protein
MARRFIVFLPARTSADRLLAQARTCHVENVDVGRTRNPPRCVPADGTTAAVRPGDFGTSPRQLCAGANYLNGGDWRIVGENYTVSAFLGREYDGD